MPFDAQMRDVMDAQDCLYTLVLKDPTAAGSRGSSARSSSTCYAPDDPEAVIEKMADPATRIVSLTVTEGGYNFHPVTGEFDADNPAVQADLVPGAVPRTTFGLITEALVRRRERGVPPFTSCPATTSRATATSRRRCSPRSPGSRRPGDELGDWVEANVRFPNSHGRPDHPGHHRRGPGRRSPSGSASTTGGRWSASRSPSGCSRTPSPLGRPPCEDVGVQVVADVEPYELMKLRLLNASHQALCYFGYLAGYRLVHDVAQDPLFADFLLAYMDREATPTLAPVPGIDLDAYKHQLIERFSNAGVRDTVARLCAESSDRIPKWLLPVIRENLAAGRRCHPVGGRRGQLGPLRRRRRRDGEPITIVDRLADTLTAIAAKQRPTRSRSSPTGSCSATWWTSPRSPSRTWTRWTPCTGTVRARRWKPCRHIPLGCELCRVGATPTPPIVPVAGAPETYRAVEL